MATRQLNIKGEVCPYTFVKSKLALEELDSGQILEVIADHIPAVENVTKSMENEGNQIVEVKKLNDLDWKIIIKKK